MTFDEFIGTHPTCRVVKNSQTARQIYDHIIWSDQNRIKMTELSDMEIPALVAVAKEIIAFCQQQPCDLKLLAGTPSEINTVKQVIGRMVSAALAPLGYVTDKKKRMPKDTHQSVFHNATSYKKGGLATERIVKSIVSLTEQATSVQSGRVFHARLHFDS